MQLLSGKMDLGAGQEVKLGNGATANITTTANGNTFTIGCGNGQATSDSGGSLSCANAIVGGPEGKGTASVVAEGSKTIIYVVAAVVAVLAVVGLLLAMVLIRRKRQKQSDVVETADIASWNFTPAPEALINFDDLNDLEQVMFHLNLNCSDTISGRPWSFWCCI